ncbi:fungal hydrophobin [Panus rudis PR-1116 ss-1]|nr:fungal hydrophobin [Panus rudis PR-1116 ss-1]
MFSRLAVFTTITLSALAAATPAPIVARGGEPASTCSTGPVQCCNSVQQSNNPGTAALLGLLGVVVQGVAVPIGITCSPISVIGAGGAGCNAQTVCCQDNSHGGIVSVGCVPVQL